MEKRAALFDAENGVSKVKGGGFSGAGYIEKAHPDAIKAYEAIRASTTDVAAISKNTGISKQVIGRVKKHLFMTEHEVPIGPGEIRKGFFTPDKSIAELWGRAQEGTLSAAEEPQFERLMAHEFIESVLMEQHGLPYRSAHPDAWDPELGARATPKHFGAHDLSPLGAAERKPFAHWKPLFGKDGPARKLGAALPNIEAVVNEILEVFEKLRSP